MEPFNPPSVFSSFDNGFFEPDLDIHKAIIQDKTFELVKILDENPNSANERHFFVSFTERGQVPLYTAVSYQNTEAVRILLMHNSDPNIGNTMGETPLHHVADISNLELAELLLEHGANPNIQENDGDTPLHYAAFKGDESMVSLLLSKGADPNIKNYELGRTPLLYAIDCEHLELVKLMIEAEGNPFIEDNLKKSGLSLSTDQGIIDLLIEKKPSSNSFQFYNRNSELRFENNYFQRNSENLDELSEWLEKANLKELFQILVSSGYDDIKILERQMRSCEPITEKHLKGIGISKPGLRHRLLVHLDTLCPTTKLSAERKINCCLFNNHINLESPSSNRPHSNLAEWLNTLKLTYLLPFFEESGYGTYKDLVSLMNSSRPITEETLNRHICIRNFQHRMIIIKDLESTLQPGLFLSSLTTERKSCSSCNCSIM